MKTCPSITDLDPYDERAIELLRQSDALMGALYPAESNHLEGPEVLARDDAIFLGAIEGGALLGCAGAKLMRHDVEYGEIKRLFIGEHHRGRGLSARLMAAVERRLVEHGVRHARLEVGIHQPEALGLYRKLGYVERSPFGDYRPDPLSLFLEKRW